MKKYLNKTIAHLKEELTLIKKIWTQNNRGWKLTFILWLIFFLSCFLIPLFMAISHNTQITLTAKVILELGILLIPQSIMSALGFLYTEDAMKKIRKSKNHEKN